MLREHKVYIKEMTMSLQVALTMMFDLPKEQRYLHEVKSGNVYHFTDSGQLLVWQMDAVEKFWRKAQLTQRFVNSNFLFAEPSMGYTIVAHEDTIYDWPLVKEVIN